MSIHQSIIHVLTITSSKVLCFSIDHTFFTEYSYCVYVYNFKSILPKSKKEYTKVYPNVTHQSLDMIDPVHPEGNLTMNTLTMSCFKAFSILSGNAWHEMKRTKWINLSSFELFISVHLNFDKNWFHLHSNQSLFLACKVSHYPHLKSRLNCSLPATCKKCCRFSFITRKNVVVLHRQK